MGCGRCYAFLMPTNHLVGLTRENCSFGASSAGCPLPPVLEATDEGVEHGNYDGVEDGYYLATGIISGSMRLNVWENHCAIETGNG